MRRPRRAKILATIGPASGTADMVEALFLAGADAFRLNFSHGSWDEHAARYAAIREVEKRHGHPIAVIADLQGPKLRVGHLTGGAVDLKEGARFRLDLDETIGDEKRAPLPHPEIFKAISEGATLLLDDGRIRLKVLSSDESHAETEVVVGGRLSDHKGVNVPHVELPLAALSPKDRRDLDYAVDLGVDWLALSFVQRPEDVAEAKKLAQGRGAVMAKMEKPAAIARLDEILEHADGLMVARGDLGVEMSPEEVPSLQKQMVRAARQAGKPVVVATQMLESMVSSPSPTRAEASDVATAVYDGADALMLSAESAVGAYPRETVAMMDRIITRVESDPLHRRFLDAEMTAPEGTAADAIMAGARQVARTIRAAAIVCYSTAGSTALRAVRERPEAPILGLMPDPAVCRRMVLSWGISPVDSEDAKDFDDMVARACRVAYWRGFADSGQRVVITAGVPFGTRGATNLLHIAWVGEYQDRRADNRPQRDGPAVE
ncbi:MAG: pyruvate kinase [Rhodospirillaceae bacterium]|nr:pyruvate kinase [Rhodospirillaceae bacterium]